MAKSKNDILQGTLVLLVLKTLSSQGRMHGYAITNHIHRISNDLLRVEEGSLYPALHRMNEEGWVRAEWGTSDSGREARFYALTAKGRKELAQEEEIWERLTEGVRRPALRIVSMRWFRRLIGLTRRHRVAQEIDRELSFHITAVQNNLR